MYIGTAYMYVYASMYVYGCVCMCSNIKRTARLVRKGWQIFIGDKIERFLNEDERVGF